MAEEIQKLEELRVEPWWKHVLESTENTKAITDTFQRINTAAQDFHVRVSSALQFRMCG